MQNGKMDERIAKKTVSKGKKKGSQHTVLSAVVKTAFFILGIMAIVLLLEWNGNIDIVPEWPGRAIPADNPEKNATEETTAVSEKEIYVYQYDVESGDILSSRYETVVIGTNTIKADSTPSGYKLAGEPLKTVTVDSDGNISEPNVGFGYEKINTNVIIHVCQYDTGTGTTLSSREETVGVGSHTIRAGSAPSGYRLTGAASETVTVDSNGNASTTDVWFGYEKINVIIHVNQYDTGTGNTLSSREETVGVGSHTIRAGSAPSGYRITGAASETVTVDSNGNASTTDVWFGYEKINTNVIIYVYQYDAETGNPLTSREETVGVGSHTIRAGSAPSGYRITGASSEIVNVDSNGNASTTEVWFAYEKIPVITEPPSGQPVYPTRWDTQFYYSDKNQQAAHSISNLVDGNKNTCFYYTIWKSEREDSSPEITVYFDGATVSKIGIVNGKVTSQNEYNQRARIKTISAMIYTYSGTYNAQISVPDTYSQQYQKFSLGGTYSGVTRIDLFLNDYYKGSGKEQYEMNIAEMQFYN